MKSQTTVLAIIVATLTACVQEDPQAPVTPPSNNTPPPTTTQPPPVPAGNSQAKNFFISEVYPSISQTCGSCHIEGRNGAPQWLGSNASAAYDQIKQYKSGLLVGPIDANLLLLKEPHAGGQQLSGQQKGLVQQWLVLEYGDDSGTPGPTFSQALENFANCMNFNDWDARNLDQLPLVPVSVDNVDVQDANCETCHLDAARAGSLLLSAGDAQATFDGFQVFPSIMKLVTSRGFPFQQLVASNRLINKGKEYQNCVVNNDLLGLIEAGQLNDVNYCHPNYIVDQDVEDELEFFIQNTIAIANNGNCANQGQ